MNPQGLRVADTQGLRATDTSPCVRGGSWWAVLSPLVLMRAKWDVDEGGMSSACFDGWTPNGMVEFTFIMPMPERSRLLWYQTRWPDEGDPRLKSKPPQASVISIGYQVSDLSQWKHDFKPGDVIIVPERDLLWFVGPDTTDKQIHVLADWIVDEHALMLGRIYQSGPPRPATETRLERTVKDSS